MGIIMHSMEIEKANMIVRKNIQREKNNRAITK